MMVRMQKDGVVMAALDNNQLAAFLNNGWSEIQESRETDKNAYDNTLSKRGRKPKNSEE